VNISHNTQAEAINVRILFVCDQFNDAIRSSGYVASKNILVRTHEGKRPFDRSRNKCTGTYQFFNVAVGEGVDRI
jgi:hypothetical protein